MGWKKEWLPGNAEICPYCKKLIYPDLGNYVCRSKSCPVVKERHKPSLYGSMLDIKWHAIFLFYHHHCHAKMTEEQLDQHISDEAKAKGFE